jgi:hypothetical protein
MGFAGDYETKFTSMTHHLVKNNLQLERYLED